MFIPQKFQLNFNISVFTLGFPLFAIRYSSKVWGLALLQSKLLWLNGSFVSLHLNDMDYFQIDIVG